MGESGMKDRAISTEPYCFMVSKIWAENFFAALQQHSWRLSIEKLEIRSLKEIINECDWNWYSNYQYFVIYSCFKSGNKVIFCPNMKPEKFISEMSWNSKLVWFLNLNPLCRLCSTLFYLDWLKILCKRQSCGLKGELMLSPKALSSSAWQGSMDTFWVGE